MADQAAQAWWVSQPGRREHYAIAAALVAAGRQVSLCTDYWLPTLSTSRTNQVIDHRQVYSFNLQAAVWDASRKLLGQRGWPAIEARNRWFSSLSARALSQQRTLPGMVFSYSYSALELFRLARSLGMRTVLGQIDPGITEQQIVQGWESHWGMPAADTPSPQYWSNWQEECELADVIMVNSEWSRSGLVSAGISAEKIRIVPLAYEPAVSAVVARTPVRRFDEERPLKVLFLGQLIVRKGIMEMMEVCEQLKDAPVEWSFVGNGPRVVTERLRQLGSRVKVYDRVPASETRRFYEAADVFILPTHSDGFGLTQLEALSSGLPVIASRQAGAVVEQDQTGLLLEEVSTSAIVTAIQSLLADPDRLERFSQLATHAAEAYSLAHLSERLVAFESSMEA